MPEKYTAAAMIDALTRTRGNKAAAARLLQCSRNTIDKYIREKPTVAAVFEEQNETMIDAAVTKLEDNVLAGDQRAIEFFLRTRGRKRGYGDRLSVDFDPSQYTDAQLAAIAAGKSP